MCTHCAPGPHDSWQQVATDGRKELFRMLWQFDSAKSVQTRFDDAVSSGVPVNWTVWQNGMQVDSIVGIWRFNSAYDVWQNVDGCWAAASVSDASWR